MPLSLTYPLFSLMVDLDNSSEVSGDNWFDGSEEFASIAFSSQFFERLLSDIL